MDELQQLISEKFTSEVLQKILHKKSGISNPTIKNITIGSGATKGESYLSVVTRFSVEISNNEGKGDCSEYVHIIAKGFPANMARRETFRSEDFFKNEIAFYDKVWPALDDFQKIKNVKNPVTIVPECLASFSDGVHDFLALEDLNYDGYSSMTRNTGLNFERTVEIIQEFGRFHALSIAFQDQKPAAFLEVANALEETYFDLKYKDWYTPVMTKMAWVLRDAVEKELSGEYLDKFDELLKKDLFGEVSEICKDRSHLCGITHGDCWAPNFLVKYDEDYKMKTKFIDYQLSRCASVITDLTFFLYVCVEPSVRDEYWNDFVKIYVDAVSSFLKTLGSNENLINIDKVKESMQKIGLFSLVMCNEAVVMSSVEDEDVVDIDEIQEVTTVDKVWIIKLMSKEKRIRAAGVFKHLVDGRFI